MTQPQAELFDLYRAGLKSATDLMKTSLESAERLQEARTLDELLALQARIAGEQFEWAMSFWSDWVSSWTADARQEKRPTA